MADSDDWRVTLSVTGQVPEHFPGQVEEDIRRRLGGGIAVGAGDAQVFLYAGTEAQARDAERDALDVLAQHGIQAESALHRWHPIEEEWEGAGVPMPQTEADREAERQRLESAEAAASSATGIAQWQVRIELGSHHAAVALARKLEGEGRSVVRRWKFLVVGASNSDEARQVADQVKAEAPPDARVYAEESGVGWPFVPS